LPESPQKNFCNGSLIMCATTEPVDPANAVHMEAAYRIVHSLEPIGEVCESILSILISS